MLVIRLNAAYTHISTCTSYVLSVEAKRDSERTRLNIGRSLAQTVDLKKKSRCSVRQGRRYSMIKGPVNPQDTSAGGTSAAICSRTNRAALPSANQRLSYRDRLIILVIHSGDRGKPGVVRVRAGATSTSVECRFAFCTTLPTPRQLGLAATLLNV